MIQRGTLDELYSRIAQYAPESVDNIDETKLFLRLLLNYALLLPLDDVRRTRGEKQSTERKTIRSLLPKYGENQVC